MNTIDNLQKDIQSTIDKYQYEVDLASVLGVLEVIKHNLIIMYSESTDEG